MVGYPGHETVGLPKVGGLPSPAKSTTEGSVIHLGGNDFVHTQMHKIKKHDKERNCILMRWFAEFCYNLGEHYPTCKVGKRKYKQQDRSREKTN